MNRPFIFEIDKYLVSSDILTEQFACDFDACKGACCIIGDSGAPVEPNEKLEIECEYDNYKEYLAPENKKAVQQQGFTVIDCDGDLVTPLIKNQECAYTYFTPDEYCLCAIEKAYFEKKCSFKKPISCWLYPIRVSEFSNGSIALNLHRWNLCKDAFKKGKREGIPVYKFLKEPIIFKFGEEFYNALEEAAQQLPNMQE